MCWRASSPDAPLARGGAIRLPPPDPALPLADRPVKVADRLAAFLLGAGELAEAAAGVQAAPGRGSAGVEREESVQRITLLLAAHTHLPLVVCGPDAGAIVAAAAGAPLVLIGARELDRAEAIADARLAAALEQALLCIDGLGDLAPADRARCSGRSTRARAAGADRRVQRAMRPRSATAPTLIVEVPHPELRRARSGLDGLHRRAGRPRGRRQVPPCRSSRSGRPPRSA